MPLGFYATTIGFIGGVAGQSVYSWSGMIAWTLLILGGCVTVIGLYAFRSWRAAAIGLFLLTFGAGCLRTSIVPTELPNSFAVLIDKKIILEGTVVTSPDERETSKRITVEVSRERETTRILAVAPVYGELEIGDRVSVSGVFSLPKPFDTDGGRVFRYDTFLAKDGIFAIVQPAQIERTGRSTSIALTILRHIARAHETFVRAIRFALPQPESALAVGIIAGGKQGLGKQLLDAFGIAGMLQIVVLSGYNVMIVAEGLLKLLSSLPRRIALAIAAAGVVGFILAAGSGSSAVRAGIMAMIALTARGTERTYDVLRALIVALCCMLLANPLLLIHDPGLQLSFMATLGLIFGVPITTHWLQWIRSPMLQELTATTLAAQIAVLPILLHQSGNLSLVALPANILAMPVIPAAMALSALAAAIAFVTHSVVPLVGIVVGLPAYALLAYVIRIAEWSAAVPFANVVIPAFPFWLVIAAYMWMGWYVHKVRKMPLRAGGIHA